MSAACRLCLFGLLFFLDGCCRCLRLVGCYNLVLQGSVSSDQIKVSIFPFDRVHLVSCDAICTRSSQFARGHHRMIEIHLVSYRLFVQLVRFWWKKESASSFLVPECCALLYTLDSSCYLFPCILHHPVCKRSTFFNAVGLGLLSVCFEL